MSFFWISLAFRTVFLGIWEALFQRSAGGEAHSKVIHLFEIIAALQQVVFDPHFLHSSKHELLKSQHFFDDSEERFDCFFSQFIKRTPDFGFESMRHCFGDGSSRLMRRFRIGTLFKLGHATTMRGAFDRGVYGWPPVTDFQSGDPGFTVISAVDENVFDIANDRADGFDKGLEFAPCRWRHR